MSGASLRGERPGFTGTLWREIQPVYAEIISHPFLRGLTDGSLPKERFRYYVVQDALYLREYARALSLVGVRSRDEESLLMFNAHSLGAITVERSLHDGFLKDLGLGPHDLARARMSPTTLAYTSYLIKTAATASYPEALCAVLPCYWIYAEVGRDLSGESSPEPMYDKWIQTYGGEDFNALVDAVLDTADRVLQDATSRQRETATRTFLTTSRYEYMFWDAGWRLETWPV
ncbi:thiaminase II [Rubrobacter radiotolerans]|uniref:Aminopyrimidine aminohydrolase n=1 Tax=Rubrobacter radiotolerans TaxID=42256 RepID=A0A023X6L4_RUBRA|nr:thiaminase II [Rubrobacter radiotolerans]AHY47709.1 thiaminase II [Rubrobacter radiotolerans]MDX5895112.1 thiaminase II [Rubrobacter radiotolerans]SMC07475.1 thiaminase (transcriptional activator TenA) [Rubrobacter radiotolerans DSM 5868]